MRHSSILRHVIPAGNCGGVGHKTCDRERSRSVGCFQTNPVGWWRQLQRSVPGKPLCVRRHRVLPITEYVSYLASVDVPQIWFFLSCAFLGLSEVYPPTSHKRFQVTPEDEIRGIQVQGARRPNNRSATSHPPPGTCSMEAATPFPIEKICWCTIVQDPHVLVRHSLHQREKWEI
ncbi:hypothetical protein TNCV_4360451 [Trichonephila clavipes]|uniref:Uncharacterized protein n=1 Tax=Trichonephila clavipes TaxID=2585209 RepID=A0A8X6WA79_TRICX|nr:hypothetical protein TNCV_4360451 [Trichonephila clavipes]